MKALTIWQPWASLIACKAKTLEIRRWQTNYRGPLAIHAAKRPYRRSKEHGVADLPYGAFLCLVDLADCFPAEDRHSSPAHCEIWEGDYAWQVRVRLQFAPIPSLGKQGLWTVPKTVQEEILGSPHVEPPGAMQVIEIVEASRGMALPSKNPTLF